MANTPLEKRLSEVTPVLGEPIERGQESTTEQQEGKTLQEQKQENKDEKKSTVERDVRRSYVTTVQTPTLQQAVQKDIENIMSEDLGDLYKTMTPEQQSKFRTKGEEVAAKVAELVLSAKAGFKNIWSLVRSWLAMIPGVNKLFLEQSSKIKTDQLIRYAQEDVRRRIEEQNKK